MAKRRVVDLPTGQRGTAVAGPFGGDRWRVEWDIPTPYQGDVWPRIPSEHFVWADDEETGSDE